MILSYNYSQLRLIQSKIIQNFCDELGGVTN